MATKKNLLFIFLILFSSVICAEKPILPIKRWALVNKTQVYFVPRAELPMVDIAIVFNAGSSYDDRQEGVSYLTNTMIGEGAKDLTSDQIAHGFEQVGAQFRTFQDRDKAGAIMRTSTDPKYLYPAIRLLSTVMTTPTFSAKELKRVKEQVYSLGRSEQQDPWKLASAHFYKVIYHNQFYAHNPLGDKNSLSQLSPKDLKQFYNRFYTGTNANLIIAGDLTENQAKKISEDIAGALLFGSPAPPLSMAHHLTQPVEKTVPTALSQSTIMIGQVSITRDNPDYFPLIVGNDILGGTQSSLLYTEVRDKRGLAYVATSLLEPLRYRGPFLMAIQTKNATAYDAIQLSRHILSDFVKNGPTEQELANAKKHLVASFPLTLVANSAILTMVTNIAFYHRPLNYLDTYQENINAVTQEQVKNAFQKNIDVNKLATIVVGKIQMHQEEQRHGSQP